MDSFFRRLSNRKLLLQIHERTTYMSQEIDDLNGAVAEIKTAVNAASGAIQDLANKLVAQSSTNPADIETAAAQLTAIAKGLQAVVVAAGEDPAPIPPLIVEPPAVPAGTPPTGDAPSSEAPPVEQPPLDAVAEGASPNT